MAADEKYLLLTQKQILYKDNLRGTSSQQPGD